MGTHIWEALVILLVVLVLFGAGKIPKLAEDLGKGINAFKKGLKDKGKEEPKTIEDESENKDAD